MHEFETRAIHAGQPADPATGAVMPAIHLSSTFKQDAVGEHKGYEYSRTGNPTRAALETCLASLEGGTHGISFASGMAAIDAVAHLLEPGDHVLASNDLYGGTYRLFAQVYAKMGVELTWHSTVDAAEFARHVRPSTRLVWLETPTNPRLELCDLRVIAASIRQASAEAVIAVDNTFATPYLQRPLELGADLVHHSTTKFLGGHSDLVGGALVTRDESLAERLRFVQNAVGAVPSPFDCFLTLRGIKTLPVRMDRHTRNATAIAEFLAHHPDVERVHYPELDGYPQRDLAKRQMSAAGGVVSFVVSGGASRAHQVAASTHIFTLAESLGGVESLIEVPAAMTHMSTADSPLAVDPALIRLSVGLEAEQDLVEDLAQALA